MASPTFESSRQWFLNLWSSGPSSRVGNDVPPDVWAKLLTPLSLINGLKLESVCKTFSMIIYSGQNRFIWCKKFQNHLYYKYGIQKDQSQAEAFLVAIAEKLKLNCRQMILKLETLPEQHTSMLKPLEKLESLYLKVQHYTDEWYDLSINPKMLDYLKNARNPELRIMIVQTDLNYLPDQFADVLQDNAATLSSLQLWRSEDKFRNDISLLSALRKFRVYITGHQTGWKTFLCQLANPDIHLEQLYIKWEALMITPNMVADFCTAICDFTHLKALSLEIDWKYFNIKPETGLYGFITNWKALCSALPASICSFSIDVQHLNFRSAFTNSQLIYDLVNLRKLKLLRIVASVKDVFPLRISAESVRTLEVVFAYVKLYRPIGHFLQSELYSMLPKWSSVENFIFDLRNSGEKCFKSVHALKLKHCLVFESKIANHIAIVFPSLEAFSFIAFDHSSYAYEYIRKKGQPKKNCFLDGLMMLLLMCPKLRVLKLADNFNKPDLSAVVQNFLVRAKGNPGKQYALYVDKMKNCKDKEILEQTISVPNLRVF